MSGDCFDSTGQGIRAAALHLQCNLSHHTQTGGMPALKQQVRIILFCLYQNLVVAYILGVSWHVFSDLSKLPPTHACGRYSLSVWNEMENDTSSWAGCLYLAMASGRNSEEASQMCPQPASRVPKPVWLIQVIFVSAFSRRTTENSRE
jgi:hypothetical protein